MPTLKEYFWGAKSSTGWNPTIKLKGYSSTNEEVAPVPEDLNPFTAREYGHSTWITDNKLELKDVDIGTSKSGYIEFMIKPGFHVKMEINTENIGYFDSIVFGGIDEAFKERFDIDVSSDGRKMTLWMQRGDALFISIDDEHNPDPRIAQYANNSKAPFILIMNAYTEEFTGGSAFYITGPRFNDETTIALKKSRNCYGI